LKFWKSYTTSLKNYRVLEKFFSIVKELFQNWTKKAPLHLQEELFSLILNNII